MHSASLKRRTSDQGIATRNDPVRFHERHIIVRKSMTRDQRVYRPIFVAFTSEDERALGIAQLRRGLNERVEYCLQVEGRAADDLEYICRRCLLL